MIGATQVNSRGHTENENHNTGRTRGNTRWEYMTAIHACAEEVVQYCARCVDDTDCGPDPMEVARIIRQHVERDDE